ncbi:siderophore-interacting protein [Pontivivens ytuae]|uniref:Siderophore-interacting protein n=1 Tax=Pontivivens ytuae TaxID=2789856 RepID=A0A7S9LVR6_9RHOB|nr:siderophore-interacting protein [Pontivivens ytuae]QPH55605.1 siderophore-interacting protein [Pontivivens ytuae]
MTPFRIVTVHGIRDMGPWMRRVTFGGPDLVDFPTGFEGGHCKLFFPRGGESAAALTDAVEADINARPRRTYTIRYHNRNAATIDMDFALHGSAGVAGAWAASAQRGDLLGLRGPGRRKLTDMTAPFYVLCADDTGLPALAATAEALPRATEGVALVSGSAIDDYPPIELPPRMTLHRTGRAADGFVQWLRRSPPPAGTIALVLSEAIEMRLTRRWLMDELGLPKQALLTSGYWKRGLTEDELPYAKQSPKWFGDPTETAA